MLKVAIPKIDGRSSPGYLVIADLQLEENGLPTEGSTLYKKVGGIAGIGGVTIYDGFWLRVEGAGVDQPEDVLQNVRVANKNSTNILVDGQEAFRRQQDNSGGGYTGTKIWVDIIKGKRVYVMQANFKSNNNSYSNLFDLILSTFRFVE